MDVFCLILESEAINGRESPAAIDQEGLNCNGGQRLERSMSFGVLGSTTLTQCIVAPWEEPPCGCV